MKLSADDKARFMQQFQDPSLEVKDLERIWDRPSGTLYRWGFELGINRPKRKGELQIALAQAREYCEEVSRELPPYNIPAHTITLRGNGPMMELILFLTDLHAGRRTASFDAETLAIRMDTLGTYVTQAIELLSKRYQVARLHIFALGDFVTGEHVGKNVTLEELEHMVLTQVYNICIPNLVVLTNRLLQHVPVSVHAVRGNHGWAVKGGASKAANWDTVVYLGWQAKMGQVPEDQLDFDIATIPWFNYAEVRNTTWLLIHGDQFKGGGTPYNSIATKVERWHQTMPDGFDYVAMGHFHHFAHVRDVWMGATMLTDDNWSREVLGRDGECGQLLLGLTSAGIRYVQPISLV